MSFQQLIVCRISTKMCFLLIKLCRVLIVFRILSFSCVSYLIMSYRGVVFLISYSLFLFIVFYFYILLHFILFLVFFCWARGPIPKSNYLRPEPIFLGPNSSQLSRPNRPSPGHEEGQFGPISSQA